PLLARMSATQFTGDASGRVSFVALSVTLFGVATLTYLTSYADTLFLGLYESASVVGQYSSAMNLTRLLLVGTGTVTFIYLPITSRLRRQRDYHGLRETYVTVTRWMALLTLPLTYVFFFDPSLSLAFTFGSGQVGGAPALSLLVLANTAAILLGPCVSTLGGLGETRMVMWFTMISAGTNIVLCFVLIPPYGMIGAAVAWSVARLVFPMLSLARIHAEHQISPFRRTFIRPAALSTAILVPLFVFVLPKTSELFLPILIVLPFVVFGGAILATRSVDRGDLLFILAIERKLGPSIAPIRRLLESRLNPDAYAVSPEPAPR
ncbi:MAG TPA: polysaccharide biosynthesis C-terminal domain-containing protein, partial [Thermoplasmata archaeon]